jgi:hypothetical protein
MRYAESDTDTAERLRRMGPPYICSSDMDLPIGEIVIVQNTNPKQAYRILAVSTKSEYERISGDKCGPRDFYFYVVEALD